jgi:ketosteroid isomerase-like protein
LHPNAQLIHSFYVAFQARDGAAMAACYAPDVRFSDPVFPALEGEAAGAMWTMLCLRGKDLVIEFRDIQADDREGSAHWEAHYSFGPSKRKVHNIIEARFEFRDGKIVRHTDSFDFHRWATQALGPLGWMFGWTGFLQGSVQKQGAAGLEKFRATGRV